MATRRGSDIASDMAENLGRLIRQELRVAADELRAKGTRAGAGAAVVAAAGVLGLYAGACVAGGLVALLARALPTWLAAVTVGAVLAVVAGLTGAAGVERIRRSLPLVPESPAATLATAADSVESG